MSILQTIVEFKRAEVERAQARLPLDVLTTLARKISAPRGFLKAIKACQGAAVIAEVKRASPSKGVLRPKDPPGAWRPEALAKAYEEGGAAGLSVLTDVHFFWGHPDALQACRGATRLPALRKDFVIDAYQVAESRFLGADAILLIARLLTPETLQALAQEAQRWHMDVLIEVHDAQEIPMALAVPNALIGVNNRDLATFDVDPMRTARLREHVPDDRVMVAESGLQEPADLIRLMDARVNTFLIGENLVVHSNPSAELKRLRGA